jgi:hypothetical protein
MRTIYLTITLLFASNAAFAMTYFLTKQWYQNGNQMCAYGNGTVLNVGINLCPLSIEG